MMHLVGHVAVGYVVLSLGGKVVVVVVVVVVCVCVCVCVFVVVL